MSPFDPNMHGALFRNDHKEPGSNQPDYRGDCMIDDVEFKMAGWAKVSRNGKKYLSLKFEEQKEAAPRDEEPPKPEPVEDDLPF